MTFHVKNYSYEVYDDDTSDEDGNTSSEDEIDIILHGTPEQRRKLHLLHGKDQKGQAKQQGHGSQESSEDEFEKEMNAELSQQVKVLEDSREKLVVEENKMSQLLVSAQNSDQNKDKQHQPTTTAKDEFYDEIYFDSDEEEDAPGTQSSGKKKHIVISNDDLLYDPDMDDEDQKWVDRQRQSHRIPAKGLKGGKKLKTPNSDALLDCPACMTTLCLDCQRHETYTNQYRAMFVMNCVVDKSEVLQCPEQATKKKKKKKNVSQAASSAPSENPSAADLFHPVRCSECNTVVGVIDHDEVYHFFNVLASHT